MREFTGETSGGDNYHYGVAGFGSGPGDWENCEDSGYVPTDSELASADLVTIRIDPDEAGMDSIYFTVHPFEDYDWELLHGEVDDSADYYIG